MGNRSNLTTESNHPRSIVNIESQLDESVALLGVGSWALPTLQNYPQPILDWSQTRKVNGKIVSDLRKQVRARLVAEGGNEYDSAIAAKETVEKYWQYKDREYAKYKSG